MLEEKLRLQDSQPITEMEEERQLRYKAGSLPRLPFPRTVNFHLCSAVTFCSCMRNNSDYAFHLEAIIEMMRVCKPGGCIRIYPIMSLKWEPYRSLDQLIEEIEQNGGTTGFFKSKLPIYSGVGIGNYYKYLIEYCDTFRMYNGS